MADKTIIKNKQADRRKSRVRMKVEGTSVRPRLTVRKSLNNVFAQIIDDEKMATLRSTLVLSRISTGFLPIRDMVTSFLTSTGS